VNPSDFATSSSSSSSSSSTLPAPPSFATAQAAAYEITPVRNLFQAQQSDATFIIIDDHPLEALGLQTILNRVNTSARVFTASSYETGEQLIDEKLTESRIELIMAYVDLGDTKSIAAIAQLHRKYPYLCIAISAAATAMQMSTIFKCLEAGAVGYIPKTFAPEIAQEAIRSILRGNIYLPPEATTSSAQHTLHALHSAELTHELGRSAQPFSGLVSLSSRNYLKSLAPEPTGLGIVKAPTPPAHLREVKASTPAPEGITGHEIGLTGRQVDVLDLILLGLSNKLICRQLNLAEGTVKVHVSAVLRALGAKNRTQAVVAAGHIGIQSRVMGDRKRG
jgi:DNA-binding NarL/FixJ family response regulator